MRCLILVTLAFLSLSEAYRILVVYPTPSFSHQRTQIAVTKGLLAAGHELVTITTDPFETDHPNITQISIRSLYETVGKGLHKMAIKSKSNLDIFDEWIAMMEEMAKAVFETEDARRLISDPKQKFDAVIVENLGVSTIYLLGPKYKAALIGLTSLEAQPFLHQVMGNPAHPVLHPGTSFAIPEEVGFLQRCGLIYAYLAFFCWARAIWDQSQEKYYQKYFPDNQLTITQIYDQLDFVIEAVSPVMGHTRPLLPNTLQVGLLHIEEPKPLPVDLQSYLDNSKRGVVYVSFGSNVESVNIGPELMATLKSVLGSIDFDVLWKYEDANMPDKPDNVRIIQWAPQMDLLAHKSIKLFIIQGGIQSMDESVARGVPILVIPFFGDQFYNAENIQKLGIGKKILKADLNEKVFRATIEEVINDLRYKSKAQELARLILDTPMPPVETAVWWIEYAIRNKGAKHLKYKGRLVPFYQYYFLDIIAFHMVLFVAAIILVKLAIRKIRRCFGSSSSSKSKKD